MDIQKLVEIVREAIIKEIVGMVLKSAIVATGAKLLYKNLPWLFVIVIFFVILCILLVHFYISQRQDLLNSYKSLDEQNNWEHAFAEKLILKLLTEKGIKRFLVNNDLTKFINKEYANLEDADIEPEELSIIYDALRQINNQETLNNIIENLIAREFVKPINNKGLLAINSAIYSFILHDKQNRERRIEKREQKREKEFKKFEKQQLHKQKPTIIRKIKNFIVDKFQPLMKISNLKHTWILDIDGTLVKHNGYKIDGYDTLLEGVKEFFETLSPDDKVVLLTARKEEFLPTLKNFLKENNIHYDYLLTDMPMGERILVNDRKPSGLDMAFAVNKNRDENFIFKYKIDESL